MAIYKGKKLLATDSSGKINDITVNKDLSSTVVVDKRFGGGVIEMPLPVARDSLGDADGNAGVMNIAHADTLRENTAMLDSLNERAFSAKGIAKIPDQSELSTAWEAASGIKISSILPGSVLKLNDIDNNIVWLYFTDIGNWTSASAGGGIGYFTNTSGGLIHGSNQDGQVYAETDGTGSVNGWDLVKATANNAWNWIINTASTLFANKTSDFITPITATNKGMTQADTPTNVILRTGDKMTGVLPDVDDIQVRNIGLPNKMDEGDTLPEGSVAIVSDEDDPGVFLNFVNGLPANSGVITLPNVASGTIVTAPADGYLCATIGGGSATDWVLLRNTLTNLQTISLGGTRHAILPVLKGTPVEIVFVNTMQRLIFVPIAKTIQPRPEQVRYPVWVGNMNGVEVEVNNDMWVRQMGNQNAPSDNSNFQFNFPIQMRDTNYNASILIWGRTATTNSSSQFGRTRNLTNFTAVVFSGMQSFRVEGYANATTLSQMFPDLF